MQLSLDNPIQKLDRPPTARRPGASYHVLKRGMDIALGGVLLLVTLPLLLACGAWIKLRDGGPVLYRQWRVGRDGWLFEMIKLRTMRLDAEASGARFAEASDPRVLPGCNWLRRSHIDELPQLWHVLTGAMSLVGPRPERPEMIEQLRRDLPGIERRLAGRPGLTGLAQLRNGYANDIDSARRKLALDLRYLRRRSIVAEVRLLLGTVPKLWDRGAL